MCSFTEIIKNKIKKEKRSNLQYFFVISKRKMLPIKIGAHALARVDPSPRAGPAFRNKINNFVKKSLSYLTGWL